MPDSPVPPRPGAMPDSTAADQDSAVTLLDIYVAAGDAGPVVMLSGEADVTTVGQLEDVLNTQITAGARILTVDLSELRFADSATIGALPSINPGVTGQASRTPHLPPGPPGTGPLVTFARSGISAPFPGDKRSVLELADACDVPTRWSCRTGVCHTCVTPLLSGDISYSPEPLEPPAAGEVLICCARPGTDIVLDM